MEHKNKIMKYLRKFETDADVQDWQMSEECVKPNVVLVGGTGGVSYNVSPLGGVMIQHIDGSFYTADEWTANGFANDQANGVAVFGDNAKFVIAKTELGRMAWSSDTSIAVEGVMLTSSRATAKTDYAGAANTALIAVDDTEGAALACTNFTFPNGAKGYLPALGEWAEAYAYKADINAAMTLIGGRTFGSSSYWSSTQYSATQAWYMDWDYGSTNYYGYYYKSDTNQYVRAFSAL